MNERIFIYFLLFITSMIVWASIQKIKVTSAEDISFATQATINKAVPNVIRNRSVIPEYP